MKLNADIVFDNLSELVSARMMGACEKEMRLGRPRFYTGSGQVFEQDTLYVIRADRLPSRSTVRPGAVLVVVGDTLQLPFYRNRCCVIQITDDADIFTVFNLVQDIFNRYEALDADIRRILDSTASVQGLVDASAPVIGADVLVLDGNFGVLASTLRQETRSLDISSLSAFMANEKLALRKREPLAVSILDQSFLCQNIFVNGRYAGSVTFDYRMRRKLPSDVPMIQYVAEAIGTALRRLPSGEGSEFDRFRKALMELVDCVALDQPAHGLVERASGRRSYVCVKMVLSGGSTEVPYRYIGSILESSFPQSVAFEHASSVVGIIAVDELRDGRGCYRKALLEKLGHFVESVDVVVGISDAFSDLLKVRLYYDQAVSALVGSGFREQQSRCYEFRQYALIKLVINAIGDFPLEMYMTDGLKRVVEHDREGSISYTETLRCYLANNMNIAKTASDLFIHRSTLLDRIARIKRELGNDLKDPDERLRLEILLKAMELYEAE